MRTRPDIDRSVLEELRARATREDKSMGQVASELLARAMGEPVQPLPPLQWNSGSLGKPRIDLEDKDAVWAVLDGRA
jgi:hypothetical protein